MYVLFYLCLLPPRHIIKMASIESCPFVQMLCLPCPYQDFSNLYESYVYFFFLNR